MEKNRKCGDGRDTAKSKWKEERRKGKEEDIDYGHGVEETVIGNATKMGD